MVKPKQEHEIAAMRNSGRLAARILKALGEAVQPGISTAELAAMASRMMEEAGARSAFLGYRGYPGAICVSVNEEIVHGIPGERVIRKGDVVSIDVGVELNGFIGDTAATFMVGVSDPAVVKVVETTRKALDAGLAVCRSGVNLGAVSAAIEQESLAGGCSVVRDFVGHGVGRSLHEEPQVPNYGKAEHGPRLSTGMTLCVEPMLNQYSPAVRMMPDGWTAVARDGGISAHFEHMIVIQDGGVEILSSPE